LTSKDTQLDCLRSDYLNLMLMPTEACNFRCVYCYETFENKKMSKGVVGGIKALIDRRGSELSELRISWFGGEPTLAFDLLTDISQHAIRTATHHGFEFSADITTNGYFLDHKHFAICLENEIRSFQISLDGEADGHNLTRKLASGEGTFDRIWANIMGMKTVNDDFLVLLRLHYTAENYAMIGKFARRVNNALDGDPRFQFSFRSITPLGGVNDKKITPITESQRRSIEVEISEISGLKQSPDLDENQVCYAAKGNSLIVRSTGRLAKCTVALSDDFNDIGTIMENGEIIVDQKKFRRWINPVIEGRLAEARCPLGQVAREADLEDTLEDETLQALREGNEASTVVNACIKPNVG
jgi:uncharacterized protein